METTPTEILENRVNLIEKLFFGEKKDAEPIEYATNISSRLVSANSLLTKLEGNVPSAAICTQLITDLKPYILQSRNRLHLMEEKVENFLARKKEILAYIDDLSTIQKLQPVVNSDNFTDIEYLQTKLEFLDEQYEPLILETKKQSQEVDELLELYEKAMRVVSDSAVSLQERLNQLLKK